MCASRGTASSASSTPRSTLDTGDARKGLFTGRRSQAENERVTADHEHQPPPTASATRPRLLVREALVGLVQTAGRKRELERLLQWSIRRVRRALPDSVAGGRSRRSRAPS
ncbi:uncharacterized protein LOC117639481 [Thrips palmi]|uniref:Uncharacterized protein LOC117639481 n=1 Tax=Thrips palmi TaxID=161013 RepID=A0A6P8ZH18_THRPL|nr:uncharacterized protein LOC117639481 [Thrips palmi]